MLLSTAWPADTERSFESLSPDEREARSATVVELFRKLGFRRVGRTTFFARALHNSNHPSLKLAIGDDAVAFEDLPEIKGIISKEEKTEGTSFPSKHEVLRAANTDVRRPTLTASFPIHHAIANSEASELERTLRQSHAANPATLRKTDMRGNTPLHVAALAMQPSTIRILLELGCLPDLQARNAKYRTPLEALAASLQSTRDFQNSLDLGPFKGHDEKSLATWQILAESSPGAAPLQSADIARIKYGCTCGKCRDGWLSSRAAFHLQGMSWEDGQLSLPHSTKTSTAEQPRWGFTTTRPASRLLGGLGRTSTYCKLIFRGRDLVM